MRKAELTFKHNLKLGRHGWIRLTPAYSVKVVQEILKENESAENILDPFSGTGTTGLVCNENGLRCDLFDINPFLVWFAEAKNANYTENQIKETKIIADEITSALKITNDKDYWLPPIHNINRWWSEDKQLLLAQIKFEIFARTEENSQTRNLLLVAFCRLVIEWSNAAFNHQSMSFKADAHPLFEFDERETSLLFFLAAVNQVCESAAVRLDGKVKVFHKDSKNIAVENENLYDCVITSPPYPNRMSYIRELRPYMYWLGYLNEAREAGELDWQAVGGTWGIATSRVEKWQPNGLKIEDKNFYQTIDSIYSRSKVLSNYVHKYFLDILSHFRSLYKILAPKAKIYYIVGNSKFYDTIVPVEKIYQSILEQTGFVNTKSSVLRKRNSKKELWEMIVTATKS